MNYEIKEFCENFDKVYVLTFGRAKERQESVKKQLDGCNFEFFMGMDLNDVTFDQLKNDGIYNIENAAKYFPYTEDVALSIGDIVCSWGHREIYKNILTKKYKNTLIFEDDLTIKQDALSSIPEMLKHLPKDADLIYWGYEINARPNRFNFFRNLYSHAMLSLLKLRKRKGFYLHSFPIMEHHQIEKVYYKPYNNFFKIAGAHYCAHAYSISEKCAKIFLEMQTPISLEADNLLYLAILHGKIKAYIATPMLFLQDRHHEKKTLPNYIER